MKSYEYILTYNLFWEQEFYLDKKLKFFQAKNTSQYINAMTHNIAVARTVVNKVSSPIKVNNAILEAVYYAYLNPQPKFERFRKVNKPGKKLSSISIYEASIDKPLIHQYLCSTYISRNFLKCLKIVKEQNTTNRSILTSFEKDLLALQPTPINTILPLHDLACAKLNK